MSPSEISRLYARLDSIHEMVSEVREDIGEIRGWKERAEADVSAQSARLSSLERSRAWVIGAVAAATALISGVLQKIVATFTA